MATLYETLADAQNGNAMAQLGREFSLSPEQMHAAVTALLPAISMGLKRATETPEGLGNLLALMGQQQELQRMYDNPKAAFSQHGRDAGNKVLATMFGSPEASRAIANYAQDQTGITSTILKKLLPIIAGLIISGLMKSGSGGASPAPQQAPPADGGGGLGDILKEIFSKGLPEAQGQVPAGREPAPSTTGGGSIGDRIGPGAGYRPPAQTETPTGGSGSQPIPGDDPLAQIMRELAKAIEEGRLKPVVIGPYEINVPRDGASGGSGQQQIPGGDILGQILREMLGSAAQKQGAGTALFGNRLDAGYDLDANALASLQQIFDRLVRQ